MVQVRGEGSAGFWRRVLTLTNLMLIITIVFLSFRVQTLSDNLNRAVYETRLNRVVGCHNQANSYAVVAKQAALSKVCVKVLKNEQNASTP